MSSHETGSQPPGSPTTRVTGRTAVNAPGEVATTEPCQTPAVRPLGSTVSSTVAGVVAVLVATVSHGAVATISAAVPAAVALSCACRVSGAPDSATSTCTSVGSHTRVLVSLTEVKAVCTTWVVPPEVSTATVMTCSPSGTCAVSKGAAAWATDPGVKSKGAAESVRIGCPVISGSSNHQAVEETPSVWARNGKITPLTVRPARGWGERRLASTPVTTWKAEVSWTVTVTGTTTSGAPGEVRTTSAVCSPAGRPVGSAVTVSCAGAAAVEGSTDNQLPPVTVAFTGMAEPSLEVTTSGLLTRGPSRAALRAIAPGSTTRPGAASTTRETVRTPETARSAVAVIRPVWVPPARPVGSAVIVTVPGALTDPLATESHGASLDSDVAVPVVLASRVTVRVCGPSSSSVSTTSVAGSQERTVVSLAVVNVAVTTCWTPSVVVTRTVIVCSPSARLVVSSGAARCRTEPGAKSKGATSSVRTGAPPMSGSSSHHDVLATPSSGASRG